MGRSAIQGADGQEFIFCYQVSLGFWHLSHKTAGLKAERRASER